MNIVLGFDMNSPRKVRTLSWDGILNGILINGMSGSGKSQTAAYLLSQFAYLGTKLIICDYDASGNEQTLSSRLSHARHSFLFPPATEQTQVLDYIDTLTRIGEQRKDNPRNHYPIMFVLDEAATFFRNTPPPKRTQTIKHVDGTTEVKKFPTYIDYMLSQIYTLRKLNIRFMFIAQDWAKVSSVNTRALREGISTKLLLRTDATAAKMFGYETTAEKRLLKSLKRGEVFYDGSIYKVPTIDDKLIRALELKNTDANLLETMLLNQ